MTTAIFGLLGVVIGAIATTASSWFFTKRKEQREEVVAIRLIREDVILAGSTLENVLRNGWLPEFDLPLEDWQEHRATLAGHLPAKEWDEVAAAMGYLNRIQVMLDSVGGGQAIEVDEIPQDGKDVIAQAVEKLKTTNDLLRERSD